MTSFNSRPVSLQQALTQAPTLARLSEQVGTANARLAVIQPLLPPALRPLVQAGAPGDDGWTLLAPHQAAAAKLRQLSPHLLRALAAAGHPVSSLRIKVLSPAPAAPGRSVR